MGCVQGHILHGILSTLWDRVLLLDMVNPCSYWSSATSSATSHQAECGLFLPTATPPFKTPQPPPKAQREKEGFVFHAGLLEGEPVEEVQPKQKQDNVHQRKELRTL